jgi:hypothetical protein
MTDVDMESDLMNTVGHFMAVAVGVFLANTFGKGLFTSLRGMTFSHVLKMEMGFFD